MNGGTGPRIELATPNPHLHPLPSRLHHRGGDDDQDQLLHPTKDVGGGTRDLARHEGLPTPLALVDEEDAVAGVHVVGLAVLLDHPEGEDLGHAVGRPRVEGRLLRLPLCLDLAVPSATQCEGLVLAI